MHRFKLSLAGALALASGSVAQVVVPNSAIVTEGDGTFSLTSTATAGRTFQLTIDSSQLAALVGQQITGLQWRLNGPGTAAWPNVDTSYAAWDVFVGPGVDPSVMSNTFALNFTSTPTQVRSGPFTFPANSQTFGSTPNAFGPTLNFTIPYVYTGGDLTIEMRFSGQVGATAQPAFDAILASGGPANGWGVNFAGRWTGNSAGTSGSNGNFLVTRLTATATGPTGRCCLSTGSCIVITSPACTASNGTYAGDGTDCVVNVCPQPPTGACCFPAGTCQTLTQAACTTGGGTYAGDTVTCAAANCPQPPPGPAGVYAVNIRTGNVMVRFPIATPAYNVVGTVPSALYALDFNGDGSKLYCITNPGNQLGVISQTTGALGLIAPISGAGAAELNWGGLTFDSSTGTMYALAGTNLYTVNLSTGATTLVAPITGAGAALFVDIAINNAGTQLIAHDIASDSMFSIDKTTGVATLLGSTGVLANFAQGMDFDPDSGNLYATIYVGSRVGGFYQVDTTTGLATLLANTQPWTPTGPEFEMAIKGTAPVACYANCDGSTGNPLLTANDFQCFLNEFAANDPYANCDESTGTPTLTANDFQCFLNKFAAGCS